MKTYVGIDIGACYIKAAKFSPQLKRVQPVKLNMNITGSFALPSAILYDKINDNFTVEKFSDGADDWVTKWLSGHILYKIITGQISYDIKQIATG